MLPCAQRIVVFQSKHTYQKFVYKKPFHPNIAEFAYFVIESELKRSLRFRQVEPLKCFQVASI